LSGIVRVFSCAASVLEAMKMENSFSVTACDGTIKSISVLLGDAVDKGQLLIEFSKESEVRKKKENS
jgi:acetyl/propionyl-CoA carboxylase alpha subunit